ncbi:hypothetical protein [Helicobacter vulpis]|uniref:hypothetical protein n=1 Tax=Helicobacter vulpis TaxID=2316076 RepID=UPI000EB4165E|nr:hypothetical protein [Helicobacter vulpis]
MDKLSKKGQNWREQAIIHHPGFERVVLPHKNLSITEPIKTPFSKVHFNDKGEIHIVPYLGGDSWLN